MTDTKMPRYLAKTYGREKQEDHASKVFDAVFGANKDSKPSTAKAAFHGQSRFGKTSFTSTRGSEVEGVDIRRRKADDEFGDPFSFDSDDDGPSSPKRNKTPNVQEVEKKDAAVTTSRNIFNAVKVEKKPAPTPALVAPPRNLFNAIKPAGSFTALKSLETNNKQNVTTSRDEEKSLVKKPQLRTYSRNHRNGTSSVNSLVGNKGTSGDKQEGKQLSMDSYLKQVPDKKDSFKKDHKCGSSQPMKKKFFTTRNDPACMDHNYSQNSWEQESTQQKEYTFDSDDFNSDDVESDLETGDPEIIFNSPKKRALEAAKALENESEKGLWDSDSERSESRESPAARSDSPALSSQSLKDQYPDTKSEGSISAGEGSDTNTTKQRAKQVKTYSSLKNLDRKKSTLASYSKMKQSDDQGEGSSDAVTRRILTSPKKMASKAVYNPRPWSMPKAATVGSTESTSQEDGFLFSDDFNDFEEEEPERLPLIKTQPRMRQMISMPTQGEEAISSLKVSREHKELFTVVRNVKQAHECQEHGETQEFKDDIEYIMDGLHDTNNTSIRCLSTLSLASKCTMPAFRMHLRAHGTLTKIFSALHDAPSYPTLALCSAAVMFMMSRDRLTMDIEKQGLELMLRLMSMDAESLAQNDHGTRTEYARNKKKIQEICEELKKVGGVKDFDFDEITTGYLAMETLLSLTSKRAGDWFKEEMRTLGGLDHIINSIFQSTEELEDDSIELTPDTVNRLKNIERCLRVLENVTYLNSDNQSHLISYKSSVLITSICRTLRICENCLPYNAAVCKDSDTVDKESPGYAVFSCLLAILRVLLNLTHDNELGSIRVGQVKGFMTTALVVILQIPQYVPVDQRFDILVLGLGLLINMVEHCDSNRQLLIATQTVSPYESISQNSMEETDSLVALVQLFTIRAQAARRAEEEHDAELEKSQEAKESNGDQEEKPNDVSGQWKESESGLEWVVIPMEDGEEVADGDDAVSNASTDIEVIQGSQEEDENFTKALHRMGKHMEDSIVAAYVALLVGCLVQEGRDYVDIVRDCLPEHNFETMIRMLKKFLGFMNLTSGGSNTGAKSIKNVIEILEAC